MKERFPFYVLVSIALILAIWLIFTFTYNPNNQTKLISEKRDVTLHFAAYGNYKEEEYLKEVLTDFMQEYPGIAVTYEIAPVAIEIASQFESGHIPGYEQKLLGNFAANDPPDLFYVPKARAQLYIDHNALLNLNPLLPNPRQTNSPQYVIVKGDVSIGISSKTKYPNEAFNLLLFIQNDWSKQLADIKSKMIESGIKGLIATNVWDSIENFETNWNALTLTMNKEELVLWHEPIYNDQKIIIYSFFNKLSTDASDRYAQIGLIIDKNGSIISISLKLNSLYANDKNILSKYITLVDILLATIHPEARQEDIEIIKNGIGINSLIPSTDFFKMTGAYYFNGIEYTTEGTTRNPLPNDFNAYQLLLKQMNPDFRLGPRKPPLNP